MPNVHWEMHPTFVQEPFDRSGLLYGQGVEWREASQLLVVRGHFRTYARGPPHGHQLYLGRNTALHCQGRAQGDGNIQA